VLRRFLLYYARAVKSVLPSRSPCTFTGMVTDSARPTQKPQEEGRTRGPAPTAPVDHAGSRARASRWLVGGILKRSLGMVERAVRFAIPNSCGVEAATLNFRSVFTHTQPATDLGSIRIHYIDILPVPALGRTAFPPGWPGFSRRFQARAQRSGSTHPLPAIAPMRSGPRGSTAAGR
jgi:hypothetical protein